LIKNKVILCYCWIFNIQAFQYCQQAFSIKNYCNGLERLKLSGDFTPISFNPNPNSRQLQTLTTTADTYSGAADVHFDRNMMCNYEKLLRIYVKKLFLSSGT
jgi:hypothetical protein